MVEPRDLFHPRRHPVSAVDADDDLLRAVEPVLLNDQPSVARRCLPGDVAKVVVADVVAQAIELTSLADSRCRSRADRPKRVRVQLFVQPFDRAEVRKDVYGRCLARRNDALDETKAAECDPRAIDRGRAALNGAQIEVEHDRLARPADPFLRRRPRCDELRPPLPQRDPQRSRSGRRDANARSVVLSEGQCELRRALDHERDAAQRERFGRREAGDDDQRGRRSPHQPWCHRQQQGEECDRDDRADEERSGSHVCATAAPRPVRRCAPGGPPAPPPPSPPRE
jgi:hypothetical protein